MARTAQFNFSGGEISPRLHGRTDEPLYQRALARLENFMPTIQGSIRMRPGSEFVRALDGSAWRLFPINVPGAGSFVAGVSASEVRVWDLDGKPAAALGEASAAPPEKREPVEIPNGDLGKETDYAPAPPAGWTTLRSGPDTFQTWAARSAEVGWSPDFVENWLLIGREDRVQIDPFVVDPGFIGLTVRYASADPPYSPSSGWVAAYDENNQVLAEQFLSVTHATGQDGQILMKTLEFLFPVPHRQKIRIQFDGVSGGLMVFLGQFLSRNIPRPALSMWSALGFDSGEAVFPLYPEVDPVGIWPVHDPERARLYLLHASVFPQMLECKLAGGAPYWSFQRAPIAGAPDSWTTPADSNPTVGEFFGGRLILSGSAPYPRRIWGSRVFDPDDFFIPDREPDDPPPPPADPIQIDLTTRGAIAWMRSQRALFLGTDRAETAISAETALSSSDFQVREESSIGGARIPPIRVHSSCLFATADRRGLRMLSWAQQTDGWESSDVCTVAEHLTAPGIVEAHWAGGRVRTLLLLLKDGTMACCTFDPGQQVVGWWRWTMQGKIRSIAVADEESSPMLWLVADRGADRVSLERVKFDEVPGAALRHLDSHVQAPFVTLDTGAIERVLRWSGLEHLKGAQASIVANAAPKYLHQTAPDAPWFVGAGTVDQDGRLTIPFGEVPSVDETPFENIFQTPADARVGLPIPTPTAIALPLEYRDANNPTTAQMSVRRRFRVRLRLLESALPLVNGHRAPERKPSTPMDTATPLITGDVEYPIVGSGDLRGALAITQDLPLPTEVLALFGDAAITSIQ